MSDELLAMLEVKSPKFTPGRGGIPHITALDVAAALGWGHDKFAALAYQAVLGGSVARRIAPRIIELMGHRQFEAWHERENRRIDAMLAVALAERTGVGLSHCRLMLDGAVAGRWPMIDARYDRIALAVLAEARAGGKGICEACHGKREVRKDSLVVECADCAGRGWHGVNDLTRANACQIEPRAYARYGWRSVYEWTLRDLCDAVVTGRRQFSDALGRD